MRRTEDHFQQFAVAAAAESECLLHLVIRTHQDEVSIWVLVVQHAAEGSRELETLTDES